MLRVIILVLILTLQGPTLDLVLLICSFVFILHSLEVVFEDAISSFKRRKISYSAKKRQRIIWLNVLELSHVDFTDNLFVLK